MKKALSFLLAIVLLVSAVPTGAFTFRVDAACSKHVYTNSCDLVCNECGVKRNYSAHNHSDCFKGYEENVEYLGEWEKTPTQTGVYGIKPVNESGGFTYHYLVVTDKNGSEVKFNEKIGGWPLVKGQKYTVILNCQYDDTPVSDITFRLAKITSDLFPDTNVGEWYSDAVTYVVGAGIMGGYSNGKFGTSDGIQRQDFLVMLARFDGADLSAYANRYSSFPDVDSNGYYKNAVMWGYENSIVKGYDNGKFGVGDKITREQLVTFLYRYAKHKGLNVDCTTLQKNKVKNTYTDYKNVSEFAQEAVVWAVTKGAINGKTPTTIVPQGDAQRCEVAQIMYNNYLKGIMPTVKLCIHDFLAATCTEPKTCTKCLTTQGGPLGHVYKDATCTSPIYCGVCGTTRGNALGHSYTAGECTRVNNGELCRDFSESYCPKLYLSGDMSKITDPKQTNKNIECDISFEYRSREQIVDGAAKIKIQGTSSTQYAKKNYTINLYQDSNYSSKKKLDVGWGGQSKYCLKANWIDKTHSRNIVTARIASKVQAKYGLFTNAPHNGTIDGFPVEVYINGEFHGLYTMNIPKDEWMFGMDKNNPNHIVICGENWNDPVLFKSIPTDLKDWTVEAGPEDDATLQKVQRLVKFVKDSSDAEFKANFNQYLNFDSTINYYIMMSYGWLSDNAGKNMLLATYDGKVWYPTLYDLDTSWGTNWRGDGTYNYASGVVNGSQSLLWQRIERLYKKEIAARYFELRKEILDPENVMAEFNNFYAGIPQEVLDRERAKWNTSEHTIPGYDFSQIQEYLNTVVPRLDSRYNGWK